MPLKIIRRSYFELVGDGHVVVAVPYPGIADSGHDVGQIVEDAVLVARCYALIGKAPKENPDPNTAEAPQEGFHRRLLEIVEENRLRYVLYVVGKEGPGIEVFSNPGEDASGIEELVASRFSKNFDVRPASENEPTRSIGGGNSRRFDSDSRWKCSPYRVRERREDEEEGHSCQHHRRDCYDGQFEASRREV